MNISIKIGANLSKKVGKPSGPGHFPDRIENVAHLRSSMVIGPSNHSAVSASTLTNSSEPKKLSRADRSDPTSEGKRRETV